MDRRKSLKAIGIGTLSAGLLLDACNTVEKKQDNAASTTEKAHPDRQPIEIEKDKNLNSWTFFTSHEMATITVLGDIIIPKDEHSGNASDAKVPEFIEFIVKDMPEHQVPMRGGLKWLDLQCMNRYDKSFVDCEKQQQLEMIDDIAYPGKVKPGMNQGVAFFDLIRNLVATGFFTSKMGIEDLGYLGNVPNKWEGVPEDIVKQYGLEDVTFKHA